MNEPSSRDAPRRLALSVEGVDVLPTDLDRFLVRVAGVWEPGSGRPDGRPELVLLEGDEELRFPDLPETSGAAEKAAPEADAFRATFSVPESLGPSLAGPLRLTVGEGIFELPPARRPGEAADAPTGATVIDRAVLAERRARRAELAEEANARRAEEAEDALRDLESELAKLEVRLEQAVAERAAAEARLADRGREARAAAQREFAERRRREESSEEASARLREAERAAREARARLHEAEARASGLAGEVELLRRRAAENEHAVATAEAARARAERLAAELGEWMETVDADDSQLAAARALSGPPAAATEAAPPAAPSWFPVGVLRSEAELARRALSAFTAAPARAATPAVAPADPEPIERALRAVEETEQRVRAVVDVVQEMARDASADRGARDESSELREFVSTAAEALRQAEGRIVEAQSAATDLSARIEQLESQLLVERSARAEAEAARAAAEAARVEAKVPRAEEPAPAEAPAPPEEPVPAEPAPSEAPPPTPWLPSALRLFVTRAPIPATRLLFELVAGQALNVSSPLEYRLLLHGEQARSVSLRPGRGRIDPLGPAATDTGSFQVTTDAAGLLDLLLEGGSRKLRRRVRVSGTWRRRRALRSIPPAELRPGALVGAKIWVDPLLVLRALTQLVDPEWTEGHDFVVAHEIEGRRPQRLWIRAASGGPLAVLSQPPREPVDVTALSTHSAFLRYLGGEPNGAERWTIRGDVNSLAVLTDWLDRARGRT